ncbi:MAG: hypothetical protein JSV25_07400 [Spirochaetota bacterium]|nr:MAG: hypothetical protein JSV25_07400 [Spirochaetota bacterium]
MSSPELWGKIFTPRLGSIIKRNRKEGVYHYLHSDGNIQPIIEDLLETGYDILNPIQPECIDPAEIQEKYGDRMTLHRTMLLQSTFTRAL